MWNFAGSRNHATRRLDDALRGWDGARRLLFCDETAETGMGVSELAAGTRTPLAVLIGPEGGFTPKKKMSSWPGPDGSDKPRSRILRTDTAVVAALALVQWLAGDGRGPADGVSPAIQRTGPSLASCRNVRICLKLKTPSKCRRVPGRLNGHRGQ